MTDLFDWMPVAHVVAQSTRGMVRAGDHTTSIQAAEIVAETLSELQQRVFDTLRLHGPMTDWALENRPEFEDMSPSTIRKRRSELYQKGRVVQVGIGTNPKGRKMKIWSVA